MQVPFYLWLIGPVLKSCKIPKYYDQIAVKQKLYYLEQYLYPT